MQRMQVCISGDTQPALVDWSEPSGGSVST